jgi:glucose/arabinose dehydrogenase
LLNWCMKTRTLRIMLALSVASHGLFAQAAFERKTENSDSLPPPNATKSVMNFSNVIGWKEGEAPVAPEGFTVTKFADGFDNPRWIYITSNGDILIAESNSNHPLFEKIGGTIIGASKSNNLSKSADRITLLRDHNKDGMPEVHDIFLDKLAQPFGMLVLDDWFYVANTDAIWRYPYQAGQTRIIGNGQKVADLPAGKHNRHWTRNIIASKDGKKIYVAVGSGSNIAEFGLDNELLRANILEMDPDGSNERVYAAGLRNPVGMGWAPGTKTLWTVVNERDELGDDLVPDYMTSVRDGGFYGWPYSYFGNHEDARVKEARPEVVNEAITPDLSLGAHTASLGLVFYTDNSFPKKYRNGAFVAQHGSWNRSTLSGYKVVFVPFANGKPGKPEDFLTGFIADLEKEKVRGRPVGLAVTPDGSLLVADDVNGVIWRISADK